MLNITSRKIVACILISCISILVAAFMFSANTSESIAVNIEQPLPEQVTNSATVLPQELHAEDSYSVGITVRCNVTVK